MVLYWYPKCSTCQKAKKWLEEKGVDFSMRDIKTENPSFEELTTLYEKSGLPLRKLFNTNGTLYKSMGLKDKLDKMSESDQLLLLSSDGMLVKRPILMNENGVAVGFRPDDWAALIP